MPKKRGIAKSLGKEVVVERRVELEHYLRELMQLAFLGENVHFIAFLQQNKEELHLKTVPSEVLNARKFDASTLDVPAALRLLTSSYRDPAIRSAAVERLCTEEVDEILQYILQLVQAIRYEHRLKCPLVQFLFDFSLKSPEFTTLFYWHVKVELADPLHGKKYELVQKLFLQNLQKASMGAQLEKMINSQKSLIEKFSEIVSMLSRSKKDRPEKVCTKLISSLFVFHSYFYGKDNRVERNFGKELQAIRQSCSISSQPEIQCSWDRFR